MGINLTNFLSSKSKSKRLNEFQDLDHIDGVAKSKSKRLNEFQDLDHIDGVAISTISADLYNS